MKNTWTKEHPLRVCTTFSGYDSQCLALRQVAERHPDFAFELAACSEIDKYANIVREALFPEAVGKNLGDITKIDWEKAPDFDLFTYSSPCQDWSNAGKGAGGAEGSGTRSSLLWECRKAIIAKKPKYLMLENVKALTSKKWMPYLQKWIDELAEYGYTSFFKVLNATGFGLPQNRERVFMISILDCEESYKFPTPTELKVYLEDMLEDNVSEDYYLTETSVEGFLKHNDNHLKKGTGFI